MSHDELLVAVRRQADRILLQDQQISAQAGQLAELMEANEALAAKLARLEHLLSRNSGNSSMPPSKDDDPGKPPPPQRSAAGTGRSGRGASSPVRRGRIWRGPTALMSCATGSRRAAAAAARIWRGARDLGVIDRYQPHEIPQVSVKVIQYDQHEVACGCGQIHIAARPAGARSGPVGYGPNLAAFAVYLMVVHFLPAHRVVALLESLTGTAPSVGFVHGMLTRTAGLLAEVHRPDPPP